MHGDGQAGSVTGFTLAVAAFLVAMVGTTMPTPLYPLLEQRYSPRPGCRHQRGLAAIAERARRASRRAASSSSSSSTSASRFP